jgi:hypothetical protein
MLRSKDFQKYIGAATVVASLWIGGSASATVHIASTANTAGDLTSISSTSVPADHNRVLRVTAFWGPSAVYLTPPLGVFFTGFAWSIYRQDRLPMPLGASFFVTSEAPGPSNFFHISGPTTISNGRTYINSLALNDRPNAILHVIAEYSPTDRTNGYNNAYPGVWYDAPRGMWTVFNQDGTPIPNGIRFHISVDPAVSIDYGYTLNFVHTSSIGNSTGNVTYIGRPADEFNRVGPGYVEVTLTGRFSYDPSLFFCLQPCPVQPGDVAQLNRGIGVFYDSNRRQWAIFTQNGTPIPPSTSFNVTVVVRVP